MEINQEVPKFQFHDNYQEVIENSTIVRDFDKFIEMATAGQLELSKSGIISIASAKLVNESITKKLPIQLKRPLLKSYPNVMSLFILFCLSGLKRKEVKGKKSLLSVNPKLLEQWKSFSDVDKYFYLFSVAFSSFSFEPINDDRAKLDFSDILQLLGQSKRKIIAENSRADYFFEMYKYKTVFMTLNMFGLIDIEDAPPAENQGWKIASVQSKKFMNNNWEILNLLVRNCKYPFIAEEEEEQEEEEEPDYTFTLNDIEEFGATDRFADKISETIPEFTKRLTLELENRPGTYYFKTKLGKASRTLKIDHRDSLDELCRAILEAFDFDYDHLYDVTFLSSIGFKLTFSGAPEISYAEYPTTEDITIGDLPIQLHDEMIFTYDYGNHWEFTIAFENIEPSEKETSKIPDVETVEAKGEAPKQYHWQ